MALKFKAVARIAGEFVVTLCLAFLASTHGWAQSNRINPQNDPDVREGVRQQREDYERRQDQRQREERREIKDPYKVEPSGQDTRSYPPREIQERQRDERDRRYQNR